MALTLWKKLLWADESKRIETACICLDCHLYIDTAKRLLESIAVNGRSKKNRYDADRFLLDYMCSNEPERGCAILAERLQTGDDLEKVTAAIDCLVYGLAIEQAHKTLEDIIISSGDMDAVHNATLVLEDSFKLF